MNNMLNKQKSIDLCQLSLTGVRALVILGLLLQGPQMMDDIKRKFKEYGFKNCNNCDDTIRIDINTLRSMGCDITRASRKDKYYKLIKHPFLLSMTSEEVKILKNIYKKIKLSSDLNTLIEYDTLFKKLADCVDNNEIKEELYGISAIKNFDMSLVSQIMQDCKNKAKLKIEYKMPTADCSAEKEIIADKLVFRNDKIYLYAFELNTKRALMLHFKRIVKILSREFKKYENFQAEQTVVTFKLRNLSISGLEENENIIERNETGFIIKGSYHNEFIAIQRILSFGSECTVISPEDFKEKIIEKLQKIKEVYDG